MDDDNAVHAARELHEDRVSENVARIQKRLTGKLWILFHAKSYLLGVLQLLENAHLLRDTVQEEKDAEHRRQMMKAFGPALGEREKAYRKLASQAAYWSGIPGVVERLELIERARDADEYMALTARFESDELPRLVQAWREARKASAEAAVQRVARLLDPKRKTVSMQALRDALGIREEE